MSDLRQSDEWAKYLTSRGWEVEEMKIKNAKCKIFIRRIPLLGSVIKIQRPPAIPPIKEIDAIAEKHRALFVKLEPSTIATPKQLGVTAEGRSHKPLTGFVPDPAPCLPTKNTVVDLTKSEKELWKTLSQDTRHDIKEAERKQVSVVQYQPGDKRFDRALESFTKLISETGRRQGFWAPNLKQLKAKTEAFGKNATLLLAYRSEQLIGGFLVLIHGNTAYYHRTATSITGRKLNAAYLLMWKTVQKAKSLGLKSLNLGSIYDRRYHKATKGWQNFSTFKKKWRGYEVEYPAPLVKCHRLLGKLIHKLDSLQFT